MLDLLIVLAFVAYSVSAGFRARRAASRGLEEYFLAGRTVKGWRAGISMAATQYAADTPLLVAGLIATAGLFALWRLWIYGLAFLMMGFLLGRVWRRAGVLTDAELVEIRYSGGAGVTVLRFLKAIYFGTVINCTVLAMVLFAARGICQEFLPWHEWLPAGSYGAARALVERVGIPLASELGQLDVWVATTNNLISIFCILAFVGLYSTTGGLRSVIATDIGQFALAMVATLLYAIFAVHRAGGLRAMLDSLTEIYGRARATEMLGLLPARGDALLPFLVLIGLQWFFQMNSDGTGYLAQRTMACRTEHDATRAGFIFAWAQILLRSLFWLPIGVALLIIYPFEGSAAAGAGFTAQREILFARGINELLPVGVRGLMLTGILAALASTIDTHLNWGASYWSNDIYKGILNEKLLRRAPSSREMVLVARLSNMLILGVALLIMANVGSVQDAWQTSLLFGAGIGSVLVLRWFWERINLWSEIAAIAASLVVAPLLLFVFDVEREGYKLLWMSLFSTAVVLLTTWSTRRTAPETLDGFYRRVRPVGWWPASAARAGDDPQRPVRGFLGGAYLVLTTAATLYLLLVGITRLLLPLPGRHWSLGLLFVGLGSLTVPLWWNRVFRAPRAAGSTSSDA